MERKLTDAETARIRAHLMKFAMPCRQCGSREINLNMTVDCFPALTEINAVLTYSSYPCVVTDCQGCGLIQVFSARFFGLVE